MLRLTVALPLAAACLAFAPPAAATQLAAPIAAFAAEQAQVCASLGGAPRVGPAFATELDLNGDGSPDYIVDLAGIECVNAWSAFCGPAGCPLSVWVARPEGYVREWSDVVQGWRMDASGEELAVVVERSGAACEGEAGGAGRCGERLAFAPSPPPAPAAPVAAPAGAGAAPAEPEAAAPAEPETPAAPAEALAAPGVEGWTLRDVPGSSPVAVSEGPGAIASLAVFCLSGQPWLAATLREPLAAETARLEFAFGAGGVAREARREDSAGGALIVELADRALAEGLAGPDVSARVSLDGAEQGVLSLRGSTRAIRGALESCLAL